MGKEGYTQTFPHRWVRAGGEADLPGRVREKREREERKLREIHVCTGEEVVEDGGSKEHLLI